MHLGGHLLVISPLTATRWVPSREAIKSKCKELRERWMEDLKLQREQEDEEETEKKAASLKRSEQEEEQEKKKKVKKDMETIQTSISL